MSSEPQRSRRPTQFDAERLNCALREEQILAHPLFHLATGTLLSGARAKFRPQCAPVCGAIHFDEDLRAILRLPPRRANRRCQNSVVNSRQARNSWG